MIKRILAASLLVASACGMPAFAEQPGSTKMKAAQEKLFADLLSYCEAIGRKRAEQALWCPSAGDISTDCRPLGFGGDGAKRTAEQNLSLCVSERAGSEGPAWATHPLNPVRNVPPAPPKK